MRFFKSLRGKIALTTALLVVVVAAASGFVIAARIDQQDRAQVNAQLSARAEKVQTDESKVDGEAHRLIDDGKPAGARNGTDLLAGTDSLTRVLSGDQVVAQRGVAIDQSQTVPAPEGFSTVTIDGQDWRSLVVPTSVVANGKLQLLQSLAPVETRLSDNRELIFVIALVAMLLSALLAWLLSGIVLKPLDRLRQGAAEIRTGTETEQGLPPIETPLEVAELTATLNEMLERLRMSMLATKRFTADAGHELRTPLTALGADIETLRHHPSIQEEQRAAMLRTMGEQHARIVSLLEGLQRLARGDSEALPDRARFDLSEVVAEATSSAARRHPLARFETEVPAAVEAVGWEDGIRLAIDNLLDNAVLHSNDDVSVHVALIADDTDSAIVIDDDGDGISPPDRVRIVDRFVRGENPRSAGSGLGLAIVEQQARLHNGKLELSDAPGGGLRAVIRIPRAD